MKTKTTLLAFAIIFSAISSFAQGSGKVTLKAEIESANEKRDLQISIINLASKDLVQRDVVSNLYFCSLPLNGRYMFHFKKEGHPATRMIVDTNTPEAMCYFLNIKLTLKTSGTSMETGISQSVGKIVFDSVSGNFNLSQEGASGADLLALTYSNSAPEVAKY